MSNLNMVVIEGNLTKELRVMNTQSQRAGAHFTVAVHDSYRNNSGDTVENTHFVSCKAWNGTVEVMQKLGVGKGTRVVVHGELETYTREDRGQNRTEMVVKANRVIVVSQPKTDEPAPAQS